MAILEHTRLSTIVPAVPVIVRRRIVLVLKHVVTLGLVPVHGLGGSDSAVGRVMLAVTGDAGLADGLSASLAGDLASETGHVHLLASAVGTVNPEPGADATTLGALLEASGDLVVVPEVPDGVMINGNNGEVLGLDGVDIGFVGDGDSGTGDVLAVVGVDNSGRLTRAGGRVVVLTTITTVRIILVCNEENSKIKKITLDHLSTSR